MTAASLFDGHDAAINIMRRLLQAQGAEVIHLGHNRSVDDVVTAAVQEDVKGIAVSSYQGGHVEYFKYLVDRLRAEGRPGIRVYGGGGGTIIPAEIAELQAYGVARIFSPQDGQSLGLAAMVNTLIAECDHPAAPLAPGDVDSLLGGDQRVLARVLTVAEEGDLEEVARQAILTAAAANPAPVLGITGTGGSGKSSLTDEIVRRFRLDQEDKLKVAVLAIDPTRRKGGGALLGDRIRMNSIDPGPVAGARVFFRSFATRGSGRELPDCLDDAIAACRAAGFDLVIVETPGIGQGDSSVAGHSDLSLYVMTPEFGAASQLEKIDMLDFADVVSINKFERRGGEDALRDVRRQLARSGEHPGVALEDLPVFGTIASRFADEGVTVLYQHLRDRLAGLGLKIGSGVLPAATGRTSGRGRAIVPPERTRYLAEVAESVRRYHEETASEVAIARRRQQLRAVEDLLRAEDRPASDVADLGSQADARLTAGSRQLLDDWPARAAEYRDPGLTGTRYRGPPSPASPCPDSRTTASCCAGCARRTCPDSSPTPPGCSHSSGRTRIRPACSPVRATLSGPTVASTCWRRVSPPPGYRPPSIR